MEEVKTESAIQEAAERIARVRHAWGWQFHRSPRPMAIDFLMAEAALGKRHTTALEDEAETIEGPPAA